MPGTLCLNVKDAGVIEKERESQCDFSLWSFPLHCMKPPLTHSFCSTRLISSNGDTNYSCLKSLSSIEVQFTLARHIPLLCRWLELVLSLGCSHPWDEPSCSQELVFAPVRVAANLNQITHADLGLGLPESNQSATEAHQTTTVLTRSSST